MSSADERVDIFQFSAAAIQAFTIESVHGVNDPRLGGAEIDLMQYSRRKRCKLVRELAVRPRDDSNPVQREILQFALERREVQCERLGCAPCRQDGVERIVKFLFELSG